MCSNSLLFPLDYRDLHKLTYTIVLHRFLLKYETRDEIEVHCQGKNGIVEMRNAIAEYEEPSPLYGFLKYRRRNVIVKYQPDDCSRLIQGKFIRAGGSI